MLPDSSKREGLYFSGHVFDLTLEVACQIITIIAWHIFGGLVEYEPLFSASKAASVGKQKKSLAWEGVISHHTTLSIVIAHVNPTYTTSAFV